MKLPTRKTNTPPPTVAELEAKRSELTARLADVTAQAAALDPLADWDRAGQVAAQQTALQNALDALAAQLVTARQLADEEARAAAEAAKVERKLAAIAALRSEARAVTAIVQHLDAGAFKALDAAYAECAAAGALPLLDVGPVLAFRQQATTMLAWLRDLDPVLVGEAPRPSTHEMQLQEAAASFGRSLGLFTEVKKMSQVGIPGKGYTSDDFLRVLRGHAAGARQAAKRLADLGATPPTLPNNMLEYLSPEVTK